MAKQWQKPDRFKLFLCPRGTFKTTIWTTAGTIFEIINNPNIRILISNANLENAKTILKGIKEHFMQNQTFRNLYPEVCPWWKKRQAREFGTMLEFTVPKRKPGIKEATVEVGSVEGNLVSRHYDLHIGDDLVNDKNVTTKEQIDKVDFFRRAVHSLLEPETSRDILIGTRWHWDDVYGRIIDDKQSEYTVYVRKILEKNKKGHKVSIFPKRFTKEEIMSIKRKQGDAIFACQYMNEPLDTENALFKRQCIKYYTLPAAVPLRKEFVSGMDIVTAIDPAVSDHRKSDYSGIVTIGVTSNEETYVLEAKRMKVNPLQLIQEIFNTYEAWKPRRIGIESFAFQKALRFFILEEMKRQNKFLPIEELSSEGNRSKDARIQALQPRIEYCPFYVTEDMTPLIDELIRYPKAKHDDMVDALAYTEQLRRTPMRKKHLNPFAGDRFKDLVKRVNKRNEVQKRIGSHRVGYG